MTVKVTKPAVNLREELADLRKPSGIAGEAMLRAETPQEQFNLIGAGGNRNMVINGAMNVAQRGTSLTMAHDGVQSGYLLDRFAFAMGSNQETLDGVYSQASDGPDGVSAKSILWTTGTAEAAIAVDELFYVLQTIEAQNCQRLGLGTSASKQVTLSFYVKSSITGTYGVNVYKSDAAGDLTASIITGTYTISSANTWERKTITFPSGTAASLGITDDNGQGLQINWHIAAGSNYTATDGTSWGDYAAGKWAYGHAQNGVVTTASATWGITGVQLELGKVATPFEHRSYGEELAACQRYFQRFPSSDQADGGAYAGIGGFGNCISTTDFSTSISLPVTMRVEPTMSPSASGTFRVYHENTNTVVTTAPVISDSYSSVSQVHIRSVVGSAALTVGNGGQLQQSNDNDAHISLDSEL